MSDVQLSKGDFRTIFTSQQRYDNPTNGVYQIYNIRKSESGNSNRKNLIMISDGVYHMKALLRNQAASKFQSLELQRGDVICVKVAEPAIVRERKKYVLLVDDFEVVKTGLPLVNQASEFLDSYFVSHPNETLRDDAHSSTNAAAPTASLATSSTGAQPDSSNQHKFSASSQKSKPIFAIEQLSPYQNIWTIKARVSYKGDIKTWHNQKGDGKLLNLNFLDTSGEIRATAFNDMATKFNEMLQEGKVYFVSKARLQPAKPQFTNLSHPYELSLDRETVIEECHDETDVPKTHFSFIKLNTVENQEANSTVDVLGIIQRVNPHYELISRAGKKFDRRDITIVDDSGYSIAVGLWNQQAIDFNFPEGSVIALKGVRVTDFGGKSLSMGFTSTMIPNPEIPEAYSLKGWYDSTGHSMQYHSLKQEPGAGASGGNLMKYIGERITIARAQAENLGRSEKGDFFSVKAAISFLKVDNFAYPACSNENCNKKVIEQPDGTWRCEKCDTNNASPDWRYMLTTSIVDETGQLWLTLFNDQAKQLLGIDANELMSLKENDPDAFTKITQSIQMNQYNFRIRAREDNYNEQSRIRYTLSNLHTLNYKAEADFLAGELTKDLLA
ncbi:RFA1 (YAR007C) [Zygosaccharomyces parabailii]|uniref:Replication protein A subunit n=1 Tax=Zygosaccharomyces bailii (strain CLIB 213 / ATCC 58445 / CBS 680 / BCRC 21525 / NBRC 1098 / NCYC 1416 / NRRL Y-2227) TaxID=1333698 RepID=A0A8J2T2S1_ZYGB2|nr:RFA1 (YAR007C) [Zygosaccharomyces parabailii]CDF87520.1 BN860_08262g1_1 [Zygosaccharomyces bailii CLIB 213]CDH09334.1 probable Replication factor A protein 1 [Zygosaccharomyces bailii ISA1307]SJM87725.1 probable Replication factor A protein 1 [Zygosaccharomyces bailii]